MPDNSRVELEKNAFCPMGVFQTMPISFGHSLSENQPTFTGVELINIHENQEIL